MSTKDKQSAGNRSADFEKRQAVILYGPFKDGLLMKLKSSRNKMVVVLEGRPLIDDAKRTCKSLIKLKLKPTLIADNMAGYFFSEDIVKEVWVSYYEGDKKGALCSIGALILGVLGKKHKIPVYCYPARGKKPFMGKPSDLLNFNGTRIVAKRTKTYVPLLEWLPGKYISRIYKN